VNNLIKIYCQNCKAYILDLDYEKLSLPFKGWMFQYRPLVEWDTAFEPEATGPDLVCPMCDSVFHDEPRLLCEIAPEGQESYLGWMFVKVIPTKQKADSTEESYMIPDLGAKPEEKPNEPSKEIPKEKPDGQKRGPGRPKKSKPAIRPNPRQKGERTQGGDNSEDNGEQHEPKHFAQLGELANGGLNIDEFPGYGD